MKKIKLKFSAKDMLNENEKNTIIEMLEKGEQNKTVNGYDFEVKPADPKGKIRIHIQGDYTSDGFPRDWKRLYAKELKK